MSTNSCTDLKKVVFPPGEIEWFLLFVQMFGVEVDAQKLQWDEKPDAKEDEGPNLEHFSSVHSHAIVRLYAFTPKVDDSSGPMGIVVVDRNKHNIL